MVWWNQNGFKNQNGLGRKRKRNLGLKKIDLKKNITIAHTEKPAIGFFRMGLK